jgi:NADH:ubiquinone oxidoreductase subunit 3 (subunit A)
MLTDWQFIGIFVVLSPIFPAAPVIIQHFLGPRRPNAIKNQTYECGIETIGDSWIQFKVQYYVYGLVFLIFDIEVLFVLPWVLAYPQMGIFSFVAGILFILLLLDGLVYAWGKGVLEWS